MKSHSKSRHRSANPGNAWILGRILRFVEPVDSLKFSPLRGQFLTVEPSPDPEIAIAQGRRLNAIQLAVVPKEARNRSAVLLEGPQRINRWLLGRLVEPLQQVIVEVHAAILRPRLRRSRLGRGCSCSARISIIPIGSLGEIRHVSGAGARPQPSVRACLAPGKGVAMPTGAGESCCGRLRRDDHYARLAAD
jgi:hypothetical protein